MICFILWGTDLYIFINYRNFYRISIRCWIHKRHPMRCILWKFGRKLIAFIMAPHCIMIYYRRHLTCIQRFAVGQLSQSHSVGWCLGAGQRHVEPGRTVQDAEILIRQCAARGMVSQWSENYVHDFALVRWWWFFNPCPSGKLHWHMITPCAIELTLKVCIWTVTLNDHVFYQSEWV